jgi:hypothetical protein
MIRWVGIALGGVLVWTAAGLASERVYQIGVARVDITPDTPVRLAGYGSRRAESEGIEQRLWAKALAIEGGATGPAVLLSVENCEVPGWIAEELASRLKNKAQVSRERFVLCSTHPHTAPCLKGTLPTAFGAPIPADHQARIDRYTGRLIDQLEKVSLDALLHRRPARLARSQGSIPFATNRRVFKTATQVVFGKNPDGLTDRALPMLRVTDAAGKLVAVVLNYACHCTTLGADFNRICGDWAGYAQEYIEREHPGAICLITIGCGADADPQPRTGLDYAKQHGRSMADEVTRLLTGSSRPIEGEVACRFERIRLPFETPPPRKEWEDRAGRNDLVGFHAKAQLARLDRGEPLQTDLSYPVQTWTFGNDLAMVFLAGEVVVDYALRFKEEFDADRLWVTAYANDVPCYIPSRRILAEGGYEAESSMILYDRPARLSPSVEGLIAAAVRRLLPTEFRSSRRPTPSH